MFRIEHLNRHQKKKRKKWNYLHKKRLISNFSIGDWLFILKSYKIYLLLQNGDGKTFFGGFWFKYAHFHSHLMHQKKNTQSQNYTSNFKFFIKSTQYTYFFHTHTTIFSNSICLMIYFTFDSPIFLLYIYWFIYFFASTNKSTKFLL